MSPGARDGRVRTIFFGSGGFAVPILDALVEAPSVEVVAVVTAPDRPAGRGHAVGSTPVAARARQLGVHVLQPSRLRDDAAIAEIAALRPELGVLADYGRIVPRAVLDLPAHGILNVHPSLLPRHRGASPIPATILAGDHATGVTLIRMDDGIDTGPIVAATELPLVGTETAPELEARAAGEGARLLARSLAGWLDGTLVARPQDDAAATLTRPLRRQAGLLDPHRAAVELERQVRAYQPWPGSYLETPIGRLTVWRATVTERAVDSSGNVALGTLVERDRRPVLMTAMGELRLDEVQPAGGRRMTGEELLRGRGRSLVGASANA